MSRVTDTAERLHFETIEGWRDWLGQHHQQPNGVWLVSWKPSTGRPAIPYEAAVEEALCHGWIDSTYRRLDDERGMLWYAPRRPGSVWAASNRERVARLEAEGRMTDAGRAVVERARADGSWSILIPVEALEVPDDLAAALDARVGAWVAWEAFPPTARREFLYWIVTAKRAATRATRVAASADAIAGGRRLNERG